MSVKDCGYWIFAMKLLFDGGYRVMFSCNHIECIKRLKPTCHVMHNQFNIQQLYALPTLYLCVLYLSENKQRLVPLTA
jgi:hypothetical protein